MPPSANNPKACFILSTCEPPTTTSNIWSLFSFIIIISITIIVVILVPCRRRQSRRHRRERLRGTRCTRCTAGSQLGACDDAPPGARIDNGEARLALGRRGAWTTGRTACRRLGQRTTATGAAIGRAVDTAATAKSIRGAEERGNRCATRLFELDTKRTDFVVEIVSAASDVDDGDNETTEFGAHKLTVNWQQVELE